MKIILTSLFIALTLTAHSQENIERYKLYNTTNIYTSLLLDSATGQIWQLQIGLTDVDQVKSVLSNYKYANTIDYYTRKHNEDIKYWEEKYNSKPDSIVSVQDKAYFKPSTLEERSEYLRIAKNGRFKLYPTNNSYNFIMVDVITGDTYQVQWNIDKEKRFINKFY